MSGHGRDTTGVKGIELRPGDNVVGMVVLKRDATILVVTELGMGKCLEPRRIPRAEAAAGRAIITVNRTERTGDVVTVMEVLPEDEIMLITKQGIIIRSSVAQVRVTGRIAQGVKLVQLDQGGTGSRRWPGSSRTRADGVEPAEAPNPPLVARMMRRKTRYSELFCTTRQVGHDGVGNGGGEVITPPLPFTDPIVKDRRNVLASNVSRCCTGCLT